MYSLTGRRRLAEQELDWLRGYEGSRPVRVGNEAAGQFQLDVDGEVLDGMQSAREAGLANEEDAWSLQVVLTEYLEKVWQGRRARVGGARPREQFVHSKATAWVGFDRMIRTAERSGLDAPLDRWRAARDAVDEEVCAKGDDKSCNTLTQYDGSKGLDAALLLIPCVAPAGGRRPCARHGRGRAARPLRRRVRAALPHRRRPDVVIGNRRRAARVGGRVLACSFWLADALALTGRRDEARDLFERLLDAGNDVGPLSEEWDPQAGRQLGNTPQVFSHVGLVNTAIALEVDPGHGRTD